MCRRPFDSLARTVIASVVLRLTTSATRKYAAGLDGGREPLVGQRMDHDRHGSGLGERLDRGREPFVDEDGGVDPAGELAQFGERGAQLALRPRRGVRLGSSSSSARSSRSANESTTSRCWAPSCRSRSSRRRALSPASTVRARDARSCSSCARVSRLQALAVEREAGGGADVLEQRPDRRPARVGGRGWRLAARRARVASPRGRPACGSSTAWPCASTWRPGASG